MDGIENQFNNIISTHTPHARRDLIEFDPMRNFDISTHTPHARRDRRKTPDYVVELIISTHTPHARRDR